MEKQTEVSPGPDPESVKAVRAGLAAVRESAGDQASGRAPDWIIYSRFTNQETETSLCW